MRLDTRNSHHVLITGGAGFIGTNLAAHLLARTDADVTVLDNLSRAGVELNLAWLKTLDLSGRFRFVRGDVRDAACVKEAAGTATDIYHLASPAVDRYSQDAARIDCDGNIAGTVNVLEAARQSDRAPVVIFASSGKVYGPLAALNLSNDGTRLRPADPAFRGISELEPIDLQDPVSCAKATADQFVREYSLQHGVQTVSLRMGCIAGPGQFGNEGQGWVAHFVYSALSGRPVTIFGDGMQVRDILHVSDVVDAMETARLYIGVTAGQAFNVGGGMDRALSVNEMLALIEHICHRSVERLSKPSRPSDQQYFVSDNSLFSTRTGWMPRRTLEQTVRDISAFWHANRKGSHLPSAAPVAAIQAA